QMPLMALYEQGFSRFGIVCAQLLLTRRDFSLRQSYLSLQHTMGSLLRSSVVPIINENDVVAREEVAETSGDARRDTSALAFGNNDQLSALVASKLDADLLVMLTDVDGVYAKDPRIDPNATLLQEVRPEEGEEESPTLGGGNAMSRGGMRSKVAAAHLAAHAGCHAVIASGLTHGNLARVASGDAAGTWYHARPALAARRRWIAFASAPTARLSLDQGAVHAIVEQGASLLAPGVTAILGDFHRGDVVELCDPSGEVIARGVTHYDAATARAWIRGVPPEHVRSHDALVHRDDLALAPSETDPSA
ncbi:MAG: glutamate 5-kinase, partial [Pseudomonadota bacterium]